MREAYPWPPERPKVTGPHVHRIHGWLSDGTKKMIREHLPSSGVVMELGTWMGKSAKFILDAAPQVRLVCIDHWLGSAEHRTRQPERDMLPHFFDLCRHHLWSYRKRVLLVQAEILGGIREVHGAGLLPGMIYVDGAHDARSVEDDVRAAGTLFPGATLVGDDWDRASVRRGVAAAMGHVAGKLAYNKKAWTLSTRCSQTNDCD